MDPVGAGAAAVPRVDSSKRTGELLRVSLICAPQRCFRPLPVRLTCCGLSVLESSNEMLADRPPVLDGLNVALMLQVPPVARLDAQGFACVREKSPAFAPVMVMPLMLSAEFPVLVSVVVCAELVVPTEREPKSRLKGTSLTVPVDSVTVATSDFELSVSEVAATVTVPLAGMEAGAV